MQWRQALCSARPGEGGAQLVHDARVLAGVFPQGRFAARLGGRLHMTEQPKRSGRAHAPQRLVNSAKTVNTADHKSTQAKSKWPSAQLSINWSATTSKAAKTEADKTPAKVLDASAGTVVPS